uniref:undecaprenyl-diphosphate phosphatase n=2 Tax=Streptococcus TaxID=1301 RepID=UPI002ECFEF89
KAVKYFIDGNTLDFEQVLILLVASVTAYLVSVVVIRMLTDYVKKHDFTVFGYYRIILGAILLVYSFLKFIS